MEYFIKQKPEGANRYRSERFGIECGDGWKKLIRPILDMVSEYNKTHDDQIFVCQIKEKFGSLRIYLSSYTEELRAAIREAERKSWFVCEECGSEENIVHTSGWIKTICQNCLDNRKR